MANNTADTNGFPSAFVKSKVNSDRDKSMSFQLDSHPNKESNDNKNMHWTLGSKVAMHGTPEINWQQNLFILDFLTKWTNSLKYWILSNMYQWRNSMLCTWIYSSWRTDHGLHGLSKCVPMCQGKAHLNAAELSVEQLEWFLERSLNFQVYPNSLSHK